MNCFRELLQEISLAMLGLVVFGVGFVFLVWAAAGGSQSDKVGYGAFAVMLGLAGAGILRFLIPEMYKNRNKEGGVLVTWMLILIAGVAMILCGPAFSSLPALIYGGTCYLAFFAGLVKLIARRYWREATG